jgi:endonuclease-3
MPDRARVRRTLDALERRYGRPRLGRRLPPLDELVLTILSQNTSDGNRDRAYDRLRRRFPSWASVARAGRKSIEEAIRPGGLARTKSRVIRDVLRAIAAERGSLDLGFLRRLPADEAASWLLRFRGVGEKTAACVLLFSCRHAAFPVDTHINRIARRLRWVRARAGTEETHRTMAALVPPGRYLTAHVNLITLGREICRPRRPECPVCPVRRHCPQAAAFLGGGRADRIYIGSLGHESHGRRRSRDGGGG